MINLIVDLPVIALRGMCVLPGMVIHFDVSRKKSKKALEYAMSNNQKIFLATQSNMEASDPDISDIHAYGTVAKIKQIIKMPNGLVRVLVEGIERGFLKKLIQNEEMLVGKVELSDNNGEDIDELHSCAMVLEIRDLIRVYAAANPKASKDILKTLLSIDDLGILLDKTASDLPIDYTKKQTYLEQSSVKDRFEYVSKILIQEAEIYNVKAEIMRKVKEKVEKNQRDYVIREQLKVLHDELSEADYESETDEFLERVEKLQASDEVKAKLKKEIKRYNAMAQSSSEGNVVRGYIETCLELPWDKVSQDNNDLNNTVEVLDKDHYGLTKVKERIVEYLAVRIATGKATSSIICLVGPPGTGKTSIARSIARALNKEYVRICLGGVRDEAEIRGHRKTYVGAMPGRIINGLKTAGVKNPLMLLDEIDKMSSDYKGDTASAMLEVLDSEQNSHFVDHYIELPVDLSQVLFIATANDLSTIPRPLLDRMEIIEVNSYTANEKFHIAREYLVAKQMEKNGVKPSKFSVTDKALKTVIECYTREAGVRNLERQIAALCRKVVKEQLVEKKNSKTTITDRNLAKYLGKKKYEPDKVNAKAETGVVRGLAWTSVGGDTLQIEVNTYSGKGELTLTGQMGDVMKESAQIAFSCARSVVSKKKYNLAGDYFEKTSFHLHIPEGAVPKDGPSAGITMTTAFVSVITGRKVRPDVAMTGEVTLRGRVLPIGGLKEKLLAAGKAGVTTVIVPAGNRKDIEEMDEEITAGITISFVETIEEVLAIALV